MTAAAAYSEYETHFDPADYAWSLGEGPATLVGRAYADESTGEAATCAGKTAVLTPYGRGLRGYGTPKGDSIGPPMVRGAAEPLRRRTVCDADGAFRFERLPSGEYEVVAELPQSRRRPWNSFLHRRVRVGSGVTEVELRQTCRTSRTDTVCFVR